MEETYHPTGVGPPGKFPSDMAKICRGYHSYDDKGGLMVSKPS